MKKQILKQKKGKRNLFQKVFPFPFKRREELV